LRPGISPHRPVIPYPVTAEGRTKRATELEGLVGVPDRLTPFRPRRRPTSVRRMSIGLTTE